MAPTKSDLSFDDLLRAGLGVPLKKGHAEPQKREEQEVKESAQAYGKKKGKKPAP